MRAGKASLLICYERFKGLTTWYTILLDGKKIGMVKRKRKDYWTAQDALHWFSISGAKTRKSAVRALLVLMGKTPLCHLEKLWRELGKLHLGDGQGIQYAIDPELRKTIESALAGE